MLRIRDIKKGDEGEYKVEAFNEGGHTEASIMVSIAETHEEEELAEMSRDVTDAFDVSTEEHITLDEQPKIPQIKMASDSVEVGEGHTLRLSCSISGWRTITNLVLLFP